MVKGWVVFIGFLLLGSVSALPFICRGGIFVSVCQCSDIAFVIFCAFVFLFALFQDVLHSGTKPFGHLEGAEVVPWLGRELVPLWPL